MKQLGKFSYLLTKEEAELFINQEEISTTLNGIFKRVDLKVKPIQVGGKIIKGLYEHRGLFYEFLYKEDWNEKDGWYFKEAKLSELFLAKFTKPTIDSKLNKWMYQRDNETHGRKTYFRFASYQAN